MGTSKLSTCLFFIVIGSLRLSGNSFSGFIKTEFGILFELEDLLLNDNQLVGSIPSEIGSLMNLSKSGSVSCVALRIHFT